MLKILGDSMLIATRMDRAPQRRASQDRPANRTKATPQRRAGWLRRLGLRAQARPA